jgi:lysophospholipase L1-like esterase
MPGGALWGYLGLCALPLAVLVDTAIARARGWTPISDGMFGRLPLAAAAMVILAALPCALARYRRWLGGHAAQLWLASAACLLGLLLAELAVAWCVPLGKFHRREPSATYRFDPDYNVFPGVRGPAASTMNSLGIRGPELPTDGYRILCLGGSTTECLYLDDAESWPAQLAEALNQASAGKAWVGAAGIADYASGHHERFLRNAALVKDVDCVVVLCGANDLVRGILGLDSGEHAPPYWLQLSAIEFLKEIWNVRLGRGLVADFDGRDFIRKRRQRDIAPPRGGFDLDKALAAYAQRVRGMAAAAKRRGVRLVLVTQPALWDDFMNPLVERRLAIGRTYPDPRPWKLLRPGPLREALDRFNLTLKAVAEETGTELVDLAPLMSSEPAFFYDDYHLSEQGCQEFARRLAQHLAPTVSRQKS